MISPSLAAAGFLLATAEDIGVTGRALAVIGIVAGALAIFLVITVLFTGRGVERDLGARLGAYTSTTEETGLLARLRLLRRFAVSAERIAERRGFLGQIETALEQANIAIRPGEAMAGALVLAIVVFMLGIIFTGNPILGLSFAAIAVSVAVVSVASVAATQRRRFEAQLPDTLNLLATSLRAGYSMLQAIDAVAEESPDPTSREFRRVLNEIRLGRSVGEAMQDSAQRMESVDFDWVVLAFTIQREVGGNLAEVLQTTSETILARGRMRGELRALTAEGRISALVLGAMPFLLFGFLYLTNRDYLDPLLSSSLGVTLLVGAVGLLIFGLFWIARLVKIDP